MKIIHYVAIAAILLNLSSCKSKAPSSKAILLVKNTWRFQDITSPTPDAAAQAALESKKEFLIDQELTFKEGNKYTIIFAAATDSSANTMGDWEISSDEKMLKMTGSQYAVIWSFGRLDDNVLELKGHDETLKVDVRYVYKRKEL